MSPEIDIDALAHGLGKLRRRDLRLRVFGAERHRYRSAPASERAVEKLENQIEVRLPDEYRRFMLHVGCGAGPYYGLFSLDEVFATLREFDDDLAETGASPPAPSRAFPFRETDVADLRARRLRGERYPHLAAPFPCDGAIPICHEGCTYWSMLVTAGAFAGTVWAAACDVGVSGAYVPAYRPTGVARIEDEALSPLPEPPTFLDWFNGWLEQAPADLSFRRSPWLRRILGRSGGR